MRFSRGHGPKLRYADDFCQICGGCRRFLPAAVWLPVFLRRCDLRRNSFLERMIMMMESVGLILLAGLLGSWLSRRCRLPEIVGMMLLGILIGPFALKLLDESVLSLSGAIRSMAFTIILLKAGIMLRFDELRRIGRPAFLLCFLPATFELAAWALLAPKLLHIGLLDAAIIGSVMGAVSPAVVVPRMTRLIEEGWGTEQGIPQMIVAGASADDVYVVVVFTALVSLASGGSISWRDFAGIPVSMVTGVLLGLLAGIVLVWLFAKSAARATKKCILLLGSAFLLVALESRIKQIVPYAGYLAVISMGMYVLARQPILARNLAGKLSKLWVGAELFLFVLVGAAADPRYVLSAGLPLIAMLFAGLLFRSLGAYLCVLGTSLTGPERLFVVLSELPKATVQAAIGSMPLALGLPCGEMALSAAILAIFLTAPLGALAIDQSYRRCLTHCAVQQPMPEQPRQ